jgi:hypothetical protein
MNTALLSPAGVVPENPVDPRTARIDGIRCDLLVDRSGHSSAALGLIDKDGFVSEHALATYLHASRPPIRDALAALVARRFLTVVPGKGYEVALVTKEILEQSRKVGYDPIEGIRVELSQTANSAFESIAETTSAEERKTLLADAHERIEQAAVKSTCNSVKERGDAVFLATETIGDIGTAAGLRWGGDILRSGLDIFEISTRWNRDQKGLDVFECGEVTRRVSTCKTLLKVLTDEAVSAETANGVFANYLAARVDDVRNSIAADSVAINSGACWNRMALRA